MAGETEEWFEPEQAPALLAFWDIFAENYEEIQAELAVEALQRMPGLGDNPGVQAARRQAPEGLALVRAAVLTQDWAPVEAWLENRGAQFAQLGVSLDSWADLILLNQKYCTRHILSVCAGHAGQTEAVLNAMHTFWARAIRTARRRYLAEAARIADGNRRALQRSEALFARLAESGLVGIVVEDSTGRITEANAAFRSLVGYSESDVNSGQLYWEQLTPARASAVTEQMRRELRERGVAQTREHAYRTSQGTIVPVLVGAAQLESEEVITFVLDLTERRKLESQVRQSQKLKAIGSLAGGIAHDFNNLLSVILPGCDLVLEELGNEHAVAAEVGDIKLAAERAAGLIEQLLAFSRKQELAPRFAVPSELVTDLHNLIQRLVGAAIEVEVEAAAGVSTIRVDVHQFQQVVLNLAVNARDAMPGGGRLHLKVDEVDLPGAMAESLDLAAGRYVQLAVSDSGLGMDLLTQQHIFEPFFTTKGEDGTGFGLSTVYGIVRQSGGAVQVHSEVGCGSTFRCYFPLAEPPADMAPSGASLPWVAGTETVLIVDEDEQVLRVARDILARNGYKVLEAVNAQQALTVAGSFDETISLLVTSQSMPSMSGLELAAEMTSKRADLRVLIMSGYAEVRQLDREALRATAHLPKPLTARGLLQAVRRVLDGEGPQQEAH